MKEKDPSQEYIKFICGLYGDVYDDREEDSSIGGLDWQPGQKALHTSLAAFKNELGEKGIDLSTAKIRKILITGGCWTTERSREVAELYEEYGSIARVAEELEVSEALVTMYLPYEKTVYDLGEDRSGNAHRIVRYRKRQKNTGDWRAQLWQRIIDLEGKTFTTSGRRSRPGVEFTYSISSPGGSGGRHYSGESIEGFGNEMWITTAEGAKKKSISRSTVELAYQKCQELMESGKLKGPKSLGIPGAGSYLYPVLIRLGVIGSVSGSSSVSAPQEIPSDPQAVISDHQ